MFDYISSISIGSIAAEMATNLDSDWWQPLTAMVVYGVVVTLVNVLTNKSIRFRVLVSGKAVMLYKNGKLYRDNFKNSRMDLNEFLALCRNAGYFSLDEISLAQLETTGQISFKPATSTRPVTPEDLKIPGSPSTTTVDAVLDGKLQKGALEQMRISEKDFYEQMHAVGIRSLRDVFYASVNSDGIANFYSS
jgi:uncharacterized membrane protein YcaP (DUF421 family)